MLETSEPKNDKPWQFKQGNQLAVGHHPYQKYGDRTKYLEMKYTAEQVLELVADAKKLNKLPVRDVQILRRIAVTLTDISPSSRSEIRAELDSHLDRVEGKSAQTINVNTTEEQDISKIADERLLRLERELSRITGSEAVLIPPEPQRLSNVLDECIVDNDNGFILNERPTKEE